MMESSALIHYVKEDLDLIVFSQKDSIKYGH